MTMKRKKGVGCIICGNMKTVDAVDNFGKSYKGYDCHRIMSREEIAKAVAADEAERARLSMSRTEKASATRRARADDRDRAWAAATQAPGVAPGDASRKEP